MTPRKDSAAVGTIHLAENALKFHRDPFAWGLDVHLDGTMYSKVDRKIRLSVCHSSYNITLRFGWTCYCFIYADRRFDQ